MSGQESRLLGRWGEALAAEHLRRAGYQILAANWRSRFGEIDLIAADQNYLCFVEVKLRKSAAFGGAAQAEQAALDGGAVSQLSSDPAPAPVRRDRGLCSPGDGHKSAPCPSHRKRLFLTEGFGGFFPPIP